MTRDYRIVLPLMAAVGLCAWVLDQIDSSKTSDRMIMQWSGLPADIEVLEKIKIAEVMTLNPASVKYSMPLLQAAQLLPAAIITALSYLMILITCKAFSPLKILSEFSHLLQAIAHLKN